jgi:Flp pilus assembly protein TadG
MPANVETFTKIASATGTGSSNALSFTAIPDTYTDLVVRGTLQTTNSISTTGRWRFNNDSGNNYSIQRIRTNGQSNFTGSLEASVGSVYAGDIVTSASSPSVFSSMELNVFSYADVTYLCPTATQSAGSPRNGEGWVFSAITYLPMTAVSRIDFLIDDGNFTTTSKLTLYGILRA